MWYTPHVHKCPVCSHVFMWSQTLDPIGVGEPLCPNCYKKFLLSVVPKGDPIIVDK